MLLYDGDCGFCSRSVRWLQTGRRPVNVAPYQQVDLDDYGLTTAQLDEQAYWVGEGSPVGEGGEESPVGGAAAVGMALRAAGGGRGVLGRMLLVRPVSAVARVVYRLVARNRHRLSRTGSCALPTTRG